MNQPSRKPRPRPAIFRALGHRQPPDSVEEAGKVFRLVRVFKHDSWAATALYQNGYERIVCKFNREQPILFVPMKWLGRALARRESKMFDRLSHVANVPNGRTAICVKGHPLPNVAAHDFIPGRPLKITPNLADDFFDEFWQLLNDVHRCNIAYVDLHKAENVLVGDDGKPHLIDFQVSVCLPRAWPFAELLARLQHMDRYHFARHKLNRCPERCDDATRRLAQRPWYIRLHRLVARPLRQARRRLLVSLGIRTTTSASSELVPEEGLRKVA